MLRSLVKRAVPYPAIAAARRALWFGFARRCAVCGASVRRMLPQGYGYPVLERLQVVGGMYKADDVCPVCHAGDRDRLVKLYLDRHVFDRPRDGLRILHMAPEKGLSLWLSALPGVSYVAGDLEPDRYFHLAGVQAMNLLSLPLPDGSVDLLLCNHVMEHIPDDRAAMREVARVLAPQGRAILQTPIALALERSVEGRGDETEAERIARFGQRDHIRIYAEADYVARLEQSGLAVERWRAFEADAEAATALRLNPLETLYVCRRAG